MGPDSDPLHLYPTAGGNLHQLRAETDCGILDILAPPYNFDDGRPCNYFTKVQPPQHPPPLPVRLAKDEQVRSPQSYTLTPHLQVMLYGLGLWAGWLWCTDVC